MKIFKGKVISKKMLNTATVSVNSTFVHRLYGKRYMKSKKYQVHDEHSSKVGDVVSFVACKPYSKMKKWKILKVGENVAKVEGKTDLKNNQTKDKKSKIKK